MNKNNKCGFKKIIQGGIITFAMLSSSQAQSVNIDNNDFEGLTVPVPTITNFQENVGNIQVEAPIENHNLRN